MKKLLMVVAATVAVGLACPNVYGQDASKTTTYSDVNFDAVMGMLEPDAETEITEELNLAYTEARTFLAGLNPQTGSVAISKAGVTLDLGEGYYFLGPKDARKVLEDLWENVPDPETLGMMFEVGTNPYDYAYTVAINFDDSGYVSDSDAAKIDYSKLLKQMQQQADDEADLRREQGYTVYNVVGWAEPPRYDDVTKRLLWGKRLQFEGFEEETLNYNMRVLGRKGVLELNYIADMTGLAAVKNSMPSMIQVANFDPGHQYADFDPSVDKKAAYGIAGLIAGTAAAKKLGVLGVLLLFLKKGWVFILLGLAALRGFFVRFFRKDPGQQPPN